MSCARPPLAVADASAFLEGHSDSAELLHVMGSALPARASRHPCVEDRVRNDDEKDRRIVVFSGIFLAAVAT
jgi:hypothetical protein